MLLREYYWTAGEFNVEVSKNLSTMSGHENDISGLTIYQKVKLSVPGYVPHSQTKLICPLPKFIIVKCLTQLKFSYRFSGLPIRARIQTDLVVF